MKSLHRGLLLAASVPLVLLLAAPAQAFTSLSDFKCLDPEDASEDLYDFISEVTIDTDGFGEGDCEKLCKELFSLCKNNVKNRIDCVETDDAFYYKLQKALCDVEFEGDAAKACKEASKSAKNFNKEQNASIKEDANFNCEDDFGQESTRCRLDCADGTLDDD